jgi:hypothetical protein
MNNSMATISTEFCDVSEFADEVWATSYCSESSTSETEIPTATDTLTATESPVTPATTESVTIPQEPSNHCDSSYPDFCIQPPPPALNCSDIPQEDFTVFAPDRHDFDRDGNGIGCES